NLGIDLVTANDAGDTDTGANNLQNFPVISSATLSGGTLHLVGTLDTNAGLANPVFRIEAFLNSACDPSGNGEGDSFVGAANVSVDGSGHAAFTIDLPTSATGTVATATATAAGTGDTSEFSACASVTGGGGGGGGGGPFVVNTTNDVNDGTCDATHCSLREAILAANAHANGDGLRLRSDGNTVDGNYIGLTADGVTPARNKAGGILVEGNGNTIGGTTSAERNVVAGNAVPSSVRSQILVTGNTNAIKGNYIGVAATGTTVQNNVTGATVQGCGHDNVIGVDKKVGSIVLGRQGMEVNSSD